MIISRPCTTIARQGASKHSQRVLFRRDDSLDTDDGGGDRRPAMMDAAYATMYRELYERHWWWRAREAKVLRSLRKLAGGAAVSILDVGCGDALMWDRLEEIGEVEGIEPDERLVTPDSPRRSRIEIADLLAARSRPGRYDIVLMLDVLEHIEDDRAALERIASMLSAGGHLILTVPALTGLWSGWDVMNGHYRRYSRKTLRVVLEAARFEIESLRYYYCWTVLPLLARRAMFRSAKAAESELLEIPPVPVNRALHLISLAEHRLTDIVPAPLGSSIIAVARKG